MKLYFGALRTTPLAVHCAWCLAEQEIPFPDQATSTICPTHATKFMRDLEVARALRALATHAEEQAARNAEVDAETQE